MVPSPGTQNLQTESKNMCITRLGGLPLLTDPLVFIEGSNRELKKYGQYTEQPESNLNVATPSKQQQANGHEQKLVFIGIDLDESSIRRVLNDCLLTDEEAVSRQDAWLQWASLWDSL